MKVAVLKGTVPSLSKNRFAQGQWVELIKEGIRVKKLNGTTMYRIAEETGLCQSTISKLYYDVTKHPRHTTIVLLMLYLGYELYAEKRRK